MQGVKQNKTSVEIGNKQTKSNDTMIIKRLKYPDVALQPKKRQK